MIHSSSFSFDESSKWDPKVVRKCLCISEEQLNILSNIPGWSKVADHSTTLRLGKDTTIEDSQSSQLYAPATTQNCQRHLQNIKLFNDSLLLQGNSLKAYKDYSKNFTRSVSLFGIDKLCDNLLDKPLKRSSSLPVLFEACIKSLHQNSDSEIIFPEKNLSIQALPIHKSESVKLDQKDTSVSKSASLETSSEVMEVVSQLPINVSSHVEKLANIEPSVKMVEKVTVESVNPTAFGSKNVSDQLKNTSIAVEKAPDNKSAVGVIEEMPVVNSNLSDQPVNISSNNGKIINNASPVDKMEVNMVPGDQTVNNSNIQAVVNNNDVPIDSKLEKALKAKIIDSESSENKLDSCLVPETVCMVDSLKQFNSEKLIEINETPAENLDSASKNQLSLVQNLISNNEESSNLQAAKMAVLKDQKLPHQDINVVTNKSSTQDKAVPEKRKSEFKNKSSKKRKHSRAKLENEVRSIKKAGEISFTNEDIGAMINIMKQFL